MDVSKCTLRPAVAVPDMGTDGKQTVWCCESVRVVIDGQPAHTLGSALENEYPFDHREPVTQEQAQANAALWAEATTVAHETGMSPAELAAQVAALVAIIEDAAERANRGGLPGLGMTLRAAIASTKQEAKS